MKIKIAHVGDLHWGMGYSGPSPDSRFNDITKVADFIAARVIEENCDLLLVAGDLFKDARVFLDRASVEITAAVNWLRKFSEAGIPVVVISGTPSHDAVAAYELIKEMRIPGVDVCTSPEVLHADNVSIACLPGINRSTMASKEEFSKMPAHQLNQVITERINQAVVGLAADCNSPSILLSHITAVGSEKGWEDLLQQNEPVLTKTAIEGAGFDLVCLGHLHNAHMVQGLNTPVYYCGSPERLSFGEEENKPGFWIYDFVEPRKLKKDGTPEEAMKYASFIETPARKFYTLEFPWSEEDPEATVEVLNNLQECLNPGDMVETYSKENIKDAIVRVRYEVTDQQAKQINQSQITKDLYDLGAYYVHGIEAKIRRTNRTRSAEATSDLTPTEALKMWGQVNEIKEADLAEMTKRAEGLEREVGI